MPALLASRLRATASDGEPAALPTPVLGLHAQPELPFAIRCPQGSAWKARAGGFAGPACLSGLQDCGLHDWPAAAHALQALLAARDVAAWLGGSFDVVQHLRAGEHLLVECPGAQGARLQALRGVLGLASETKARLLSGGVQWQFDDGVKLAELEALCCGHAWGMAAHDGSASQLTIVAVRSGASLVAQVAEMQGDLHLGELLATLPTDDAIVHQGQSWWRLGSQAGTGGRK